MPVQPTDSTQPVPATTNCPSVPLSQRYSTTYPAHVQLPVLGVRAHLLQLPICPACPACTARYGFLYWEYVHSCSNCPACPACTARYGFLYSEYVHSCYNYESWLIVRKLLILSVILFLGTRGIHRSIQVGTTQAGAADHPDRSFHRDPRAGSLSCL